jgi:glycosyltransferase involved in cell wall biosynthesis
LPSLGENFGHAIYESLLAGVPVVIGNNTPWKHIEDVKAGIEINPKNAKALSEAIMRFIEMDPATYQLWREGANKKAHDYYSSNNFKQIYLDLFS